MSGTHALERPTYRNSLGEVVERAAHGGRTMGKAVLDITSRGIARFETYMTARSLPEGYVRSAGMAALEGVDPAYARVLEQRFEELS